MHLRRTKHCAGGSIEVCYTCKKEFESYWHLMNHRREEHPSNRVCRYFKQGSCDFEDGECWCKHTTKTMQQKEQLEDYSCKECEHKFETKKDVMKHKKMVHGGFVSICKNFAQGKCDYDENSCWFKHTEDGMDTESEDEQVFQNAQEKTPPDQNRMMMDMINNLSIQVEMLRKKIVTNM